MPEFRIGLISDTHGLLRPEALERLSGADHIIHAGDIGRPEIIEVLRALAPTTAIRGNIDRGAWADAFPHVARARLGGLSIHVVHALADLDLEGLGADVAAVVSGHTHRPMVERRGGLLLLNPGSAGPKRFKLPITVASLWVAEGNLRAEIHELAV